MSNVRIIDPVEWKPYPPDPNDLQSEMRYGTIRILEMRSDGELSNKFFWDIMGEVSGRAKRMDLELEEAKFQALNRYYQKAYGTE